MEVFVWPLVVVIAMLLFRKPFVRFVDRAEKIRTSGFEVAAGAQDTSKSEVGPSVANAARQPDDPILVEREKSFCTELGLGVDPTPRKKIFLG